MTATDKVFAGSIPALYESHMVPLLFAPYAVEMVKRVAADGHTLRGSRRGIAHLAGRADHSRAAAAIAAITPKEVRITRDE